MLVPGDELFIKQTYILYGHTHTQSFMHIILLLKILQQLPISL